MNRLLGVAAWIAGNEPPILLLTSPLFIFSRPAFAAAPLFIPELWLARRDSCGYLISRTPADWAILGLPAMGVASTVVAGVMGAWPRSARPGDASP